MQVTGQITVKADGDTLLMKAGQVTFNFGGKERTMVYADNRPIGFAQTPVGATVSGTLAHVSNTDMRALAEHESVTLLIECDTGKRYVVREAFATQPPELSGEEGDVSIEYMGQVAEEL